MSGADASIGIPTQNGAVLAVEEANKNGFAGGKFKLEASLLDDAVQGKHDPNAGAQNVKTFIADDAVLAMVGPFNSNVAKAEIPLTNDAGLVQISPSNTNDGLTVGDDAKKLRTAHPDTNAYFRVCTRDAKQGQTLAQFAAQRLGFKKAFIIDDNETYGKGLADVFDAQYRKLGGTVLGHEHITANQVDFKALLTKIKSQNPDVVFFGGNTSTGGGLIRRQMADVGMAKTPFLGGDGISRRRVREAGRRHGERRVHDVRRARRGEAAVGEDVRRRVQGAVQERRRARTPPTRTPRRRSRSRRSRKRSTTTAARCRRAPTCSRTSPRRRTSTRRSARSASTRTATRRRRS